MPKVSGDRIICFGRLGTFQETVVLLINCFGQKDALRNHSRIQNGLRWAGCQQRRNNNVCVNYHAYHLAELLTIFLAERRTSEMMPLIWGMDNLSVPCCFDLARISASQLGSGAKVSI